MTQDIQTGRSFSPYETIHQMLHEMGYTQRDNFIIENELITDEKFYSYTFYHEEFGFISNDIQICITPEGIVMFYHEDEDCWYGLNTSPDVFYKYVYDNKPRWKKKNQSDR